ncbi:MAG TPA: ABC transporter substrate-binding protein [Pelagibacterium sp.]|uniref:ABC transporter substrate-binding protein n=1 Tax=Pelagibacterium sp. TaxID=1967288 RepID=UPI002BF4AB62|nr:ABC transporter substrate-binding protein [Pelagibacterium sp.]HWJ88680.1 ABC transporter substrate-binding protein [Pelagibacterium sp.]
MRHIKKSLTLAVAAGVLTAASPALSQDVTIGFLGGLTGPIEAMAPGIVAGAQLALDQVNEQGGILDGGSIRMITVDSACDATGGANAGDRLVNTENVTAIVGGLCTGETIGAAQSAGIPGNVVMISPASTAPSLTTLDDNDLVFRTTPSDAFQGVKLAELMLSKGIDDVALTYVNNDYGVGFADAFATAYEAGGGTITANLAHEDLKADYRAELGNLASSGSETLVVLAYASSSGQTIIRQALESGNFLTYAGGDGMVGDSLFAGIDASALDGMIVTRAGAFEGESASVFADLATAAGVEPDAIYAPQAYDAAFLLALAIEKNGNNEREGLSAALREISTAPGEIILPGEWEKARELIAAGQDINYEGAGGTLDFDAAGDIDGVIVELRIEGGQYIEVGVIE